MFETRKNKTKNQQAPTHLPIHDDLISNVF